MGAWGASAWENDGAADWFGRLFKSTKLDEKIEQELQGDLENEEEIRAAAHVLAMLGRVYIWPIDNRGRLVNLAITKLEALKAHYPYDGHKDFAEALDKDIAALRAHL